MALLPSIASTLAFSMPAGPVGMVWVSLTSLVFVFLYMKKVTNSGRVCILGRFVDTQMLNVRRLVGCELLHHACRSCNGMRMRFDMSDIHADSV